MEKQIIQILFYDELRGWVKDTLIEENDEIKDQEETLTYIEE